MLGWIHLTPFQPPQHVRPCPHVISWFGLARGVIDQQVQGTWEIAALLLSQDERCQLRGSERAVVAMNDGVFRRGEQVLRCAHAADPQPLEPY